MSNEGSTKKTNNVDAKAIDKVVTEVYSPRTKAERSEAVKVLTESGIGELDAEYQVAKEELEARSKAVEVVAVEIVKLYDPEMWSQVKVAAEAGVANAKPKRKRTTKTVKKQSKAEGNVGSEGVGSTASEVPEEVVIDDGYRNSTADTTGAWSSHNN